MNANWNELPAWKRKNLQAALKPAQACERATGIPACVTLAQFLLESNWGKSDCGGAKNYFGIKADPPGTANPRWKGEKVNLPTKEFHGGEYHTENHWFRKYLSMSASFVDHGNLLLTNRYKPLFKNTKSDFRGWCRDLRKCGYATDPQYPALLIELIEIYGLNYYNLAS